MHHGRNQILDAHRFRGRASAVAVRCADDLAHVQPAAGEQQRCEFAPVVAAAVLVDLRRAAHLSAADEQHLVIQAARFQVVEEGAHGVVERWGHVAHAFGHRGVVDVGVHVPDEVRRDGDEPGPAFDAAPRQQQQFAKGASVVRIELVVVPLLVDLRHLHQRLGIVRRQYLGVFLRQVEGIADAPEQQTEGFLAGAVEGIGFRVESGLHSVEGGQQRPAIPDAILRQRQGEILLESPAAAGHEWRLVHPERPCGQEVPEAGLHRLGLRIDRLREECDIRRHSRARVVAPGDAGVGAAEVREVAVFAHDWLDVVVAVAGDERAHDREAVGSFGELGEGAAEGDAGDRRLDFAGGTAGLGGCAHLGVEGFDLARPAVQEQEDHGLIGERLARVRGG